MFSFRILNDLERMKDTQLAVRIATVYLIVPFCFLFWLNDWLIFPERKWELLYVRIGIIPLAFLIYWSAERFRTWKKIQRVALASLLLMSLHSSLLMYTGGASSYTYAVGLILIHLSAVAFVPFERKYFLWTPAVIYLGFLATAVTFYPESGDEIASNSLFIAAAVAISVFLRQFMERARLNELKVRMDLKGEVENRQRIIETKTEQTIQLTNLSRQFSPQVVEALRSSQLGLTSKVHNAEICALFVDIVGSTKIVDSQSGGNIDKVISLFMDVCSNVLLRYDITIDKFLGDGVLALSNVPFQYDDFIERVLKAAFDLEAAVTERQEEFDECAGQPFMIRSGIALGRASVGFYGSQSTYHSYTAIGAVINLAHRLCENAEPGHILVHPELVDRLKSRNTDSAFQFSACQTRELKGFGQKVLIEVRPAAGYSKLPSEANCDLCGGALRLDLAAPEANIFKCRSCGHTTIEPVRKVG